MLRFEAFGFDPGYAEFEIVGERAVSQRFFEGLVAVFVLDVLADDGDGDFVLRGCRRGGPGPATCVRSAPLRLDVEILEGQRVDAFLAEDQRALRRSRRRPWR